MHSSPLLFVIIIFAVVMLVSNVLRSRKQAEKKKQQANNLVLGARVMLSCGLFGSYYGESNGHILIKIHPDLITEWDKRAIIEVLPAPEVETPAIEIEPDSHIHLGLEPEILQHEERLDEEHL